MLLCKATKAGKSWVLMLHVQADISCIYSLPVIRSVNSGNRSSDITCTKVALRQISREEIYFQISVLLAPEWARNTRLSTSVLFFS